MWPMSHIVVISEKHMVSIPRVWRDKNTRQDLQPLENGDVQENTNNDYQIKSLSMQIIMFMW